MRNLTRRGKGHRRVAAAVSMLAVVATVLGAAPAAALDCNQTMGGGVVIVLEPQDVGVTTTIAVRSNVLYVNGALCEVEAPVSVAIAEAPMAEQAADIVIDLTEPMRINDAPVPVTLDLDPDPVTGDRDDRVRIIGAAETDLVGVFPTNVVVSSATDYPGAFPDSRLTLDFPTSEVDLEFDLGAGNDTFEVAAEAGSKFENSLIVRGGDGNDVLSGGPNADTIRGGDGNDILAGNGGDDDIAGGPGNDTIRGGSGDDDIAGGAGDDTIRGGSGADNLRGQAGDDTIRGGKGADNVRGQAGDDTMFGQSGKDTLHGGSGADEVRGGTAADTVMGGKGADVLYGNAGPDTIRGGPKGDFINGGPGRDMVFGNSGNDEFEVDDGFIDTVSGGAGNKDACNECDDKDVVRKSVEIR